MKKFLIISCAVLAIACFSMGRAIKDLRKEKARLTQNNEALMATNDLYKSENGKYIASIQALTLTKNELEKNRAELVETVKGLNIKVKRLQSASSTATKTDVKVQTIVKDSIVYMNGAQDTLQAIRWQDNWIDIQGELRNKELNLSIRSTDTLKQIVHRVPRKFLFFRFGTKAIRQEIISSNPHTKIVYSEYIELKK